MPEGEESPLQLKGRASEWKTEGRQAESTEQVNALAGNRARPSAQIWKRRQGVASFW